MHIRALIEAFRAEGHVVRESALVERAGSARENGAAPPRNSRWAWVKRLPPFALELAEYGYGFPAARRLLADARDFAPDLLYERHAFGNRGGRIAARRSGLPWVLEVNSPMVHELSRTRGLAFPRLARRVEHEILCAADVVVWW